MGGLKEEIAKGLPEGAVVGEVYTDPADETKIIIEYTLNNKLYQVSPERIVIQTLLDYFKCIPLIEGLTYNDVYEIISQRHALELIKGIDYDDNPAPITQTGRMWLPISKYSLRFLPGALVADIVEPETALIGNEDIRDLSDTPIVIAESGLRFQLYTLAFRLFDCRSITCFQDGKLSVGFRRFIASQIEDSLPEVKQEILASFLIMPFSDELSDVVLLVGPSNTPYFIRLQTAEGDTP